MRFPRHWALARSGAGVAWGWSDESLADAQAEASRRATELASRLRGGKPARHDGYYPDRPMREEVLREVAFDGAALTVAVTRNAAGAEVLNAARGRRRRPRRRLGRRAPELGLAHLPDRRRAPPARDARDLPAR